MPRTATINRKTNETDIALALDLDGAGACRVATGVGFFDHMLDLLARHAIVDLDVAAAGDLHVDAHHTVEDVGIALGQAIERAVGDKRGLARYGHFSLPMDETLAHVALDLSGRPAFVFNVAFTGPLIGTFPVELVGEFFKSVANAARMNLHVNVAYGTNNHHISEAIFKAFARALRMAATLDPAAARRAEHEGLADRVIRVVLQQPALPKYRVPVFRALAARPGIDLHVVYGEVPGLPNEPADGFRSTFVPLRFVKVGAREAIFHAPQIHFASRKRADVLIATWNLHYVTLVPGLLRARAAGVRTILWGHGYSRVEGASRSFLRAGVGKLADALLFYGDRTADAFAADGWPRERLFVARNSLDQTAIAAAREHWLARPDDLAAFRREHALGAGPTLLFVSRLLPENRLDLLLDAVASLSTTYPTINVVLIGKGEQGELRAHATRLGLASRVRFLGPIYDELELAPHFLTADAFVYPAKLGLSIMHSFGYGLPLITSGDASAQMPEREALRDGVNGLTYRDGDAADLARAIDAMLRDPARRRAMGDAALETIRSDYSIDRMVDGFEAAIRYVASR